MGGLNWSMQHLLAVYLPGLSSSGPDYPENPARIELLDFEFTVLILNLKSEISNFTFRFRQYVFGALREDFFKNSRNFKNCAIFHGPGARLELRQFARL